ncbi:MAG TPA: hypothetical protein VIT00_11910 [Terrimicrobiaceae bacterium]
MKQQLINDYWKPRRLVIAFCRSPGCTDAEFVIIYRHHSKADLKLEALRVAAISIRDKIRKRLVIY